MTAYYNENNPFAAQWLRNLIEAGHIAPGFVDERSIEDVKPSELVKYRQCHFFAGIGAWSYALRLAGWPDDQECWTGSCPCQPFSAAGKKGGFADERHLWPAWHHIIREQKPSIIFGEQVASKSGLEWFDLVRNDLEGEGYACGAADICAAGAGAPHIRQRLWFVANSDKKRLPLRNERRDSNQEGEIIHAWRELERVHATRSWAAREVESSIPVFDDGTAGRVGKISAYGNAINPWAAKIIIEAAMEIIA